MFSTLSSFFSLQHENILALFGFSVNGPNPCLVYEFMPCGSLEDRLLCEVLLDQLIKNLNSSSFVP